MICFNRILGKADLYINCIIEVLIVVLQNIKR